MKPAPSPPQRICLRTPAKLNLFLELIGKRADGFHDLETVMVSVSCYDTLSLRLSPRMPAGASMSGGSSVRLRSRWRPSEAYWRRTLGDRGAEPLLTIADDDRNLIHRAISRVCQDYSLAVTVDVQVNKRIPAGAGMGGGSSDAAAAIQGLAMLAGLTTSEDGRRLMEIAAELGSDIPFFLRPWATACGSGSGSGSDQGDPRAAEAAIGRGRGERLEPLTLPSTRWFVVVYPPLAISTAAVYENCRIDSSPQPVERWVAQLTAPDRDALHCRLLNRLLEPASEIAPEVGRLLSLLSDSCQVPAMMTGSGSACFVVCRDRSAAAAAAERVRRRLAERRDWGHVMVLRSVATGPQVRIGR